MSCLCVVDQLIGADNAEVTLGHQRSDQLSSSELSHEILRVVPGRLRDPFERGFVDTSQNSFDCRGVADQDDRAA